MRRLMHDHVSTATPALLDKVVETHGIRDCYTEPVRDPKL